MGCLVDHLHLDKNTFSILFQKGTICASLLIILLIVTVYIFNKQQGVGLELYNTIYITQTYGH
jgi:hypothetical protein